MKNKIKDDIIRCRIKKYEFDIFGLAKVNTNWTHVPEADHLVHRYYGGDQNQVQKALQLFLH